MNITSASVSSDNLKASILNMQLSVDSSINTYSISKKIIQSSYLKTADKNICTIVNNNSLISPKITIND
jgi:hypothetical protein